MNFTRKDLSVTTTRTPSDYNSTGGLTAPALHTPEADASARELARALVPRTDPHHPDHGRFRDMDPVARAAKMAADVEELRSCLDDGAAQEALDYEVALRAGRPPAPEPERSEDERWQAALAAMGDSK